MEQARTVGTLADEQASVRGFRLVTLSQHHARMHGCLHRQEPAEGWVMRGHTV